MVKAIMISIKPKWCKLIESGKKTIEVRKTRPQIDTPFKCYIYCTADKKDSFICRGGEDMPFDVGNGTVIGEFVCDKIIPISVKYSNPDCRMALKEFPYVCLTDKQIIDYLGNGVEGYGWHITDLVIYDEPKDLSEFKGRKLVWRGNNHIHEYEKLTRPPQSWFYVEENK